MRTIKQGSAQYVSVQKLYMDNKGYYDPNNVGVCEDNQTNRCLEVIDTLLKRLNLEIALIDEGPDEYVFMIRIKDTTKEHFGPAEAEMEVTE